LKTVLIKGRSYLVNQQGSTTYLTAPGESEPTYKVMNGRLYWYKKRMIFSNFWEEIDYHNDYDNDDDLFSYIVAYMVFNDLLSSDYNVMAADDYVDENEEIEMNFKSEPSEEDQEILDHMEELAELPEETISQMAEEIYSEPEPARHEEPEPVSEPSYSSSDDSGSYDSGGFDSSDD